MRNTSIFDYYRFLLTIVVCTYVAVRFASVVWRWRVFGESAGHGQAVLQRYVLTVLWRVRARRFWLEFLQVGGLVAVLACLVCLHT